jgi:predicted histone-like DNA-binding protein
MSVFYRLIKSNMKGKSEGRYYAKAVSMGEIHLDEMAKILSASSSVTEGDVYAVLKDLTNLMKREMGDGHTVVLDGLGRFRIAIESDTVETPSDFNVAKHIRGLQCKFIAQGYRRGVISKVVRPFTEGIKCKQAPINDVHDEEKEE